MTDLTALPADITPEDFFMEVLPDVLCEVDIPDGLGSERMQFNVVGEDGVEIHIGIDEEGDLTLEEGQADAPPIAVTVSTEDFQSIIAGDLRDRIKAETGKVVIGPRQLKHAFLPDSKVQQIKALSGDLQLRIIDDKTGEEIAITTTLGGAAPNVDSPACTVSLDVPTLLEATKNPRGAQQLFFAGRIRVDGDMGIVLGLMGLLSAP